MIDRRRNRTAVLVCTHDGAPFIEEQLDSIAAQTQPVDEIHVYDWASTDGTVEIVERWSRAHAPRKVMTTLRRMEDAPGPARSFLQALAELSKRADLDLVFLCDQDDIWLPQKTATFLDAFASHDEAFDLAFSDASILRADGGRIETFYGKGSPYRRPGGMVDASVLVTNPAIGMTMCVRREWLARIAPCFHLYWVMHDWALYLLCWLTNGRRVFIDVPLVLYRQHAGNALGAAAERSLLSRAATIGTHIGNVRRQLRSVEAAAGILAIHSDSVHTPAIRGRFGQARVALSSAILTMRYRLLLAAALLLR
jgi:glycosyltransferase involved in cell wall biosynthesis